MAAPAAAGGGGGDGVADPYAADVSALFAAIRKADYKLCTKLLEKTPSLATAKNQHGEHALFAAAERGLDLIVRVLLKYSVTVDEACDGGRRWTAFHAAAWCGSVDVTRALVAALVAPGTCVDCSGLLDVDGRTPLHIAAQYGKHQVFDVIAPVAKSWPRFMVPDRQGRTPLHLAVRNGHEAAVQVLLRMNTDKEARDTHGRTPFLVAVAAHNTSMMTLLASKGCNINAVDVNGVGALFDFSTNAAAASLKGFLKLQPNVHLRDGSTGVNAVGAVIHKAAVVAYKARLAVETSPPTSGWLCCVAKEASADLNAAAELAADQAPPAGPGNRYAGLHIQDQDHFYVGAMPGVADRARAARETISGGPSKCDDAFVECLQVLLAAKCEPNATGVNGLSPLYMACDSQLPLPFVNALLRGGADLEGPPAPDGSSAFFIAVEHRNQELAKTLLDAGAKVDAHRHNGGTSMHSAAQLGHEDMVKFLVENGASLSAANNGGWTPLFVAAYTVNLPMVELLLDMDANAKATDANACTPAMVVPVDREAPPNVTTQAVLDALRAAEEGRYVKRSARRYRCCVM